MNTELPQPPGFWRTVFLLLGATKRKASGRRKRQQELLYNRAGRRAMNWTSIGFGLTALLMFLLNGLCSLAIHEAVHSGQLMQAAQNGRIVVSSSFMREARFANSTVNPDYFRREAERIAERQGGDAAAIEKELQEAARTRGMHAFIDSDQAAPGLSAVATAGPIPAMLGSFMLLWWAVMLVFQGEGLEVDLQRRRHPIWEWLFTHPVSPGAVFLAEMLAPIAANPIYWGAPLFVGLLYGMIYGLGPGIAAAFLIGIPVSIAAACLGKALEIAVVLRFAPRSRGAVVGIMSWLGYASMMLFFVGALTMPRIVAASAKLVVLVAVLPWPWLRWFLGAQLDGSFSFVSGMFGCWVVSGVAIAASVWFSVWGAQQGLAGNFAAADALRAHSPKESARYGKEPLYRKEFLWFVRDRSAIVQTILVPLTVAGLQLFNLRGMLRYAQGSWNYLCGAAILFGTYFLWVLGPKSLTSEGTALWIPLTWPRGLESLLKAKAWLWSMISSGIVALILLYTAFLFSAEIWKIALVGVGWFFFSRSMAEKSVTLVTVTSSSGEHEKIPRGPSLGSPARHAHLFDRYPHAAMAPGCSRNCLLLSDRRGDVGEPPRSPSLPLRSVVRKASAAPYADACHGLHQHSGRRGRGIFRIRATRRGPRESRHRSGHQLRNFRNPRVTGRMELLERPRRLATRRCPLAAGFSVNWLEPEPLSRRCEIRPADPLGCCCRSSVWTNHDRSGW